MRAGVLPGCDLPGLMEGFSSPLAIEQQRCVAAGMVESVPTHLVLVDVDLQEQHIWRLLAESIKLGCQHLAGTAPLRKKIHHHLKEACVQSAVHILLH